MLWIESSWQAWVSDVFQHDMQQRPRNYWRIMGLEHYLLSPETRLLLKRLLGLSPHDHFYWPSILILFSLCNSRHHCYELLGFSSFSCYIVHSLRFSIFQTPFLIGLSILACCPLYFKFPPPLSSLSIVSTFSIPITLGFTLSTSVH